VTSSYFIPTTFQQEVIGIFSYFIHEYVEIYVDNFTTYGDEFDVALANVHKLLMRCKECHIVVNNEKN